MSGRACGGYSIRDAELPASRVRVEAVGYRMRSSDDTLRSKRAPFDTCGGFDRVLRLGQEAERAIERSRLD